MIIKSLSRKSGGIGQLFRYLFREEKVRRKTHAKLFSELTERVADGRPTYVAGIRLTPNDVKYLLSEMEDARLLSELKAFKGTVREFIQQQLISQRPDIVKESKPLVITHNLRNRSLEGYIREFERNEANRIHQRSNQTAVQHVILSWANTDSAKITDAMLKDMAKEYIRLRGENNLYCITKHEDKDHVHLHVAVSGTQLNGLSSRVSQKEFAEIKLGMDSFQREQFPLLSNSLPEHGKKENDRGAEKNIKRLERTSVRENLLRCLDETGKTSISKEHFLTQLADRQAVPYERSGKLTGVTYEGYKFRFSRLGVDLDKAQELFAQNAKATKDIEELQSMRKGRDEMKLQKSDRLQALSFEEITGKMSVDEKRSYVQGLYDRSKEFEKSNNSANNEKDNLRELEDIRSSRSESDMEKNDGRDIDDDQVEDSDETSKADAGDDTTEDEDKGDAFSMDESDLDDLDDDQQISP